jgi:membrane protease YdiL (CAAX protease family)
MSHPDDRPRWTAGDAALTFTLAVATFLLVAIVAGGGLAGVVIAEALGLAVVPIAVIRLRRLPIRTIGLVRPDARAVAAAALLGASLWYVAARLVAPWVEAVDPDHESTRALEALVEATPLAAIVVLTLIPAICEEVASRGVLALGLARRLGTAAAVVISATAFAALHMSIVRAVPTGLLGAALAILAIRSGSVVPAMIAHAINNALALLVGTGRLDPVERAIEAHPDLALVIATAASIAGLGIGWRARPAGS